MMLTEFKANINQHFTNYRELKERQKSGAVKKPSIATVPKRKESNIPKVTKPVQANSRGGAKR